jgi:hypothetical protein
VRLFADGFRRALARGAILLVVFDSTAHAYTDPGSGLLIWQSILAGIFAAGYYLRKLIRALRFRKNGKKQSDPPIDQQV